MHSFFSDLFNKIYLKSENYKKIINKTKCVNINFYIRQRYYYMKKINFSHFFFFLIIHYYYLNLKNINKNFLLNLTFNCTV